MEIKYITNSGLCRACNENPSFIRVQDMCAEPRCFNMMTWGCVVWRFTSADRSSGQYVKYCKEHFDKLPPRKSFEQFEKEKQEEFQREEELKQERYALYNE